VLYWQALAVNERPWTVFITDPYSLTLPDWLPLGTYRIEIGMYDPASGARLPVARHRRREGDRVFLPETSQITIR
jgi:hypothetical protein